jgi:hypothetical protein
MPAHLPPPQAAAATASMLLTEGFCWCHQHHVPVLGAGIDTGYSYRYKPHGMSRYKTKNDWGMGYAIPAAYRGVWRAVSHTRDRPHGVTTVWYTANRSLVYPTAKLQNWDLASSDVGRGCYIDAVCLLLAHKQS